MGEKDKKNSQGKSKKKTHKLEETKVMGEKETEEAETEEPKENVSTGEIVLKLFMHCEWCTRKVKKSLIKFQGVEVDYKTSKVIVKGKKADPLKVLKRIEKKISKSVELVSSIPKPSEEKTKERNKSMECKKTEEKKEKAKSEENKKNEEMKGITVVLKIQMYCVTCSQEIQKRIMKMKGVVVAEPDMNNSEVKVKGVFDPSKLLEYIYKENRKTSCDCED